MIAYQNGMPMRVGDTVLIEHGRTQGVVVEIIEALADLQQWRLKEPGITIKSLTFGFVFLPVSTFSDDPVVFVGRDET
jgi:hypothetical protein